MTDNNCNRDIYEQYMIMPETGNDEKPIFWSKNYESIKGCVTQGGRKSRRACKSTKRARRSSKGTRRSIACKSAKRAQKRKSLRRR